ncbi:hypothetical protein [Chromatium okenii]|jgi:hypothetical protein|uniref:hypothetical protein n=1 Tax=Chromatium okenii TaxID=61644 RepID=UPI0026EE1F86|nr:hypothetical protein [Chromatium okenii]MBV5308369.1 hypothetical protein [Chromatium okenii]
MKLKPDVSAFLDGATETPIQKIMVEITKPEPTVQKMFRLRWDVASTLKLKALQESATSRRRVTETEIVERLLQQYFDLDAETNHE